MEAGPQVADTIISLSGLSLKKKKYWLTSQALKAFFHVFSLITLTTVKSRLFPKEISTPNFCSYPLLPSTFRHRSERWQMIVPRAATPWKKGHYFAPSSLPICKEEMGPIAQEYVSLKKEEGIVCQFQPADHQGQNSQKKKEKRKLWMWVLKLSS